MRHGVPQVFAIDSGAVRPHASGIDGRRLARAARTLQRHKCSNPAISPERLMAPIEGLGHSARRNQRAGHQRSVKVLSQCPHVHCACSVSVLLLRAGHPTTATHVGSRRDGAADCGGAAHETTAIDAWPLGTEVHKRPIEEGEKCTGKGGGA